MTTVNQTSSDSPGAAPAVNADSVCFGPSVRNVSVLGQEDRKVGWPRTPLCCPWRVSWRVRFSASEATATWRFTNFVLYCIVLYCTPQRPHPRQKKTGRTDRQTDSRPMLYAFRSSVEICRKLYGHHVAGCSRFGIGSLMTTL